MPLKIMPIFSNYSDAREIEKAEIVKKINEIIKFINEEKP